MTDQGPRVEAPGRHGAGAAPDCCQVCGAELELDSAGQPYCVTDGLNFKKDRSQPETGT